MTSNTAARSERVKFIYNAQFPVIVDNLHKPLHNLANIVKLE